MSDIRNDHAKKPGRRGGRSLAATIVVVLALAAAGIVVWRWMAASPVVPEPAMVRVITPEEAKKRIDSGEKVVLLDVRTPAEHVETRIPGSVLLPVQPEDQVTGGAEKAIADKNAVVFVYCRSGRRSGIAAEILVGLGYRNVYDLGGIASWPYATESGERGTGD